MNAERTYRHLIRSDRLVAFGVRVQETDLMIHAGKNLKDLARELVFRYRGHIETYIERYPEFLRTLRPWPSDGPYPEIVAAMVQAGRAAQVGPMAAVAGALAEKVGNELLAHSEDVIVENGGDVFIKTTRPLTMAIFAGKSPLSLKVGLTFQPDPEPFAVCTSSGTVGHSFSYGVADAVCVIAGSCALADAAATAVGNRIHFARDIQAAIEFGQTIEGVRGLVAIMGEAMGMWGRVAIQAL
jgi:ApbE superfamily uncharacterized protein (UPF0280 family)